MNRVEPCDAILVSFASPRLFQLDAGAHGGQDRGFSFGNQALAVVEPFWKNPGKKDMKED